MKLLWKAKADFKTKFMPLNGGNALTQGFSTFWYLRTPKSMLYPYEYPQIKIWYKLYPLDKKSQKKRQFLVYFKYMKDLGMSWFLSC